jgi:glycosyltransferase involved in cell wall biosynthesis
VFNLANHLTQLGVQCLVFSNENEKDADMSGAKFETISIEDLLNNTIQTKIDLIHVWTPREVVREITERLLLKYQVPYIVHLEDNEEHLIESILKVNIKLLNLLPNFLLNTMIQPHMSHPTRYTNFLKNASGITIINEKLNKFCPPNIPTEVIWAGYQEDLPWNRAMDAELKQHLGIGDNELIIAYTGNIHRVNYAEVANLYRGINILYSQGYPIKLIRTGTDYISFLNRKEKKFKTNYCIELGRVDRNKLPSILSITDILVQPGKPDNFNNYRFPSKLPEYLASGKPVILPKSNIGLHLKNMEECLWLEDGSATDIAQKIELLISNPNLRQTIGQGGRAFAEQNLKWGNQAEKLYTFYKKVLS